MFGRPDASDTDAVELLKRDHDDAEQLFDQYEDAKDGGDDAQKVQIAAALCRALTVHAAVEEEIFYPALRASDEDGIDLLDEALVEHATVKHLIAAIEAGTPDDPLYDATVRVLAEYVKHHVKEEEGEIFPLARRASLDLNALGAAIEQRRSEVEAAPDLRSSRRNGRAATATPEPAASSAAPAAAKSVTRKAAAHGRH